MTAIEQIAHFSEVPMEVDVQLDRRPMRIRDVLELEAGAVIKLNRSAGENIDLLVGGSLVAFGEIVIIDESMGVRITDFNEEE
jgi:flagellar motor switch protein FliN/FliY